jgi:hypothetical protein
LRIFPNREGSPKPVAAGPQPVILIMAALWILWGFGYQTVWERFTTQVDGVVISSRDVPSKGAPRYGTEYVIRGSNGQEQRYDAGATDGSLERSMPVGTRIRKEWGDVGYEANGQWISFPIAFYAAIFGVASGCLLWATLLWRASR